MDHEQLPFGYSQRQKRTHAHMEEEDAFSSLWPLNSRFPVDRSAGSPSHPTSSNLHLPMPVRHPSSSIPARRYPGDGMDYRRPVSLSRSGNNTPIIDLTNDEAASTVNNGQPSAAGHGTARASRPPRFAREIIDVEAEPDRAEADYGSEIQFIGARAIHPPRRPTRVGVDNDEDLEIVGVNEVPEERRRPARPALDIGGFMHLRRAIIGQITSRREGDRPRARAGRRVHTRNVNGGLLPGDMDFTMIGFDMGLGGRPEPPPPTYEAPPLAPEGFTRTPAKDDVLVCPNCEDELCTGETDVKKQVWILKACGHVYCGECATNRHASNRRKGKEKVVDGLSKPFKTCLVEGCDKKTISPKSMIQVFL